MNMFTLEEALNWDIKKTRQEYKDHINPVLAQMSLLLNYDRRFVRAEGTYVWDEAGEKYLDFLGSFGALSFGHNHPEVIEAVKQVNKLPNYLQVNLNAVNAALAHNLTEIMPGKLQHLFFGNSGTEAVEGAIKMARIANGKSKLVSTKGSFHGKTMGALSLTGKETYQKPFAPLVPDCIQVPYGEAEALAKEMYKGDVAAVILEPIQGEGGIILPPDGYLGDARDLCDRYDAYLIIDEVQTGLGRTGYNFACEHENIAPDIMCMAKSLSGSLVPISAVAATAEIWHKAYGSMETYLLHTSTFGGNTVASAAALTAINILVRDDLAHQAREKGQYFLNKLAPLADKHQLLKEVRGRGLMIGLEFYQHKGMMDRLTGGSLNKLAEEYTGALIQGELLNKHRIITNFTLNNPNVIRLQPPLAVSYEDLDYVVDALDDILSKYKGFVNIAFGSAKTALGSMFSRR
ncbi:aspartate aminotransferase family protein [Metallumcola ferriviriculae]|uniref:Aspartate aminotransferase family protein n=1 Tax=Metallumcola ferriviriculae TaxID=3039180 RepID=A0AAU0UR81_9FIRM|nr:aspartate aminotransferase family protein [Desulfitibacteraceae bacterium MK1]